MANRPLVANLKNDSVFSDVRDTFGSVFTTDVRRSLMDNIPTAVNHINNSAAGAALVNDITNAGMRFTLPDGTSIGDPHAPAHRSWTVTFANVSDAAGQTDNASRTITVSTARLYAPGNAMMLARTIAHEMQHAYDYQAGRMNAPGTGDLLSAGAVNRMQAILQESVNTEIRAHTREYAMRVWLKPDKMLTYNISAPEVVEVLRKQNVEAAPGKIGESSGKKAQTLQYVLRYTGKFNKQENYENIVVKATEEGELVKLKDIADIEFDSQDYNVLSKENGKPSAAIMLKQRPGTNASDVIERIKNKMAEIQATSFPPGMGYTISYDVSEFLDASIYEVLKTLIEAFILVAFVVFIFLQDVRSTLIPIIAIPVSLIGTFFFMQLFGFSLNLITLFAMVLAIGIVVDNAIVVI
ncbi:MAG TPA: efflux RND transporter permease subunit, partial [Saprospiraceae bacterium]|nr:efflux RND transporter permease subunit [Saprospiraceae bacterium]